jgi:Mlc titration factor MtfA (ptsG expression regulator)
MPVLGRNVVGTMRKKQKRQKLKAAPFLSHWSSIIEDHFPLYARLPDEDRKELQGHIQVFLAEKRFEGCGGLDYRGDEGMEPQTRQSFLPLQRNHFLSVRATSNSGTLRCMRN